MVQLNVDLSELTQASIRSPALVVFIDLGILIETAVARCLALLLLAVNPYASALLPDNMGVHR